MTQTLESSTEIYFSGQFPTLRIVANAAMERWIVGSYLLYKVGTCESYLTVPAAISNLYLAQTVAHSFEGFFASTITSTTYSDTIVP